MSKPGQSKSTPAVRGQQQQEQQETQDQQQESQAAGCLLRLYWMVFGYLLAIVSGISIINHQGAFSVVDIFFWLAVLGIPAARWVDIHKFKGMRADGQPATMRDWMVHTIGTLLVALVGWLFIHYVRVLGIW